MTLTNRNRCFKAGITISSLALILVIAAAVIFLSSYQEALAKSVQRPQGFFQRIISGFMAPAANAPFVSAVCAAVYSLAGISLIYYYFEKTQSPEILFIGLFVISFAFECIRTMIPLKLLLNLPTIYLTNSYRILLFGRYFGLFSLFTVSMCTAGLNVRKQETIILVCATTSLIFAVGIPIDALSWDSTLVLLNDYNSTFVLIQMGIIVITTASFLVAAYTRGSGEFIFIGMGALLTFTGRNILFSSDTWISLVPGFLLLCLGTWFICTKYHRLYLWL